MKEVGKQKEQLQISTSAPSSLNFGVAALARVRETRVLANAATLNLGLDRTLVLSLAYFFLGLVGRRIHVEHVIDMDGKSRQDHRRCLVTAEPSG